MTLHAISMLKVGSNMYQALPGSPSPWSSATRERIPSFGSAVILTPGERAGTYLQAGRRLAWRILRCYGGRTARGGPADRA